MNIDLLNKVTEQVNKCYEKYGGYASSHEALSVFLEEVDELTTEIRKKDINLSRVEAEIIDNLTVLFKMYEDVVINNIDKKRNKLFYKK